MRAAVGGKSVVSRIGPAIRIFAWFAVLGGAVWVLGFLQSARTPDQLAQIDGQPSQASTGREIWVAPGYVGTVDVYTPDIQSTGGYWEAIPGLTLTLHGPAGSADIVGTSDHKQDWGNSHLESMTTVHMDMSVSVPADAAIGSDWHGELVGAIITGSDFDSMVLPEQHNIDIQGITVHVTTPEEVGRHSRTPDPARDAWIVVQWGLSALVLIAGVGAAVRVLRGRPWMPLPRQVWGLIDRIRSLPGFF